MMCLQIVHIDLFGFYLFIQYRFAQTWSLQGFTWYKARGHHGKGDSSSLGVHTMGNLEDVKFPQMHAFQLQE